MGKLNKEQPGLECVVGHHLFMEAFDEKDELIVSWCLWDGGGVTYHPDRMGGPHEDEPLGWTPTYNVRVPDGWHRFIADYED